VKIIDFGVAQTAETMATDVTAQARGTTRFMAPELFAEEVDKRDTACDVYSFAVVVAELWTGTVAWSGTPKHEIPDLVVAGRRPFSPDELSAKSVPGPIIALIVACWAQDLYRRSTFTQLSELRGIPKFYLAPQERWPLFLQTVVHETPSLHQALEAQQRATLTEQVAVAA
jgi:serine/threonine protein kinase